MCGSPHDAAQVGVMIGRNRPMEERVEAEEIIGRCRPKKGWERLERC